SPEERGFQIVAPVLFSRGITVSPLAAAGTGRRADMSAPPPPLFGRFERKGLKERWLKNGRPVTSDDRADIDLGFGFEKEHGCVRCEAIRPFNFTLGLAREVGGLWFSPVWK